MSRFLVGNNHLSALGGSETFTFAFVEELVRLGHEVDVICPTLPEPFPPYKAEGLTAKLWNEFRVRTNSPWLGQPFMYDAAFLSHNTTVAQLFRMIPNFDASKVIQTIHGAFDPLEQPYHDGHRQIQYVTISDELREKYPYAQTIMNGVNLERFKPGEKIPGSVLSMCQSEAFNQMLSEICGELGLSFKSRNKFTNPIWEIETELATAEIAIGIGRSAIEAMACGCAVLIADHRPYQGALTDGWAAHAKPMRRSNYSGRWLNVEASRSVITSMLEAGKEQDDAWYYRGIAETHHDIRKQVQRYLEMVNG